MGRFDSHDSIPLDVHFFLYWTDSASDVVGDEVGGRRV